MSIYTQAHYLDLVPGVRAPLTVHVSQGDTGTQISFTILKNGQPFNLTNLSVSVHGTRRDGANFGPFQCTYTNGTNIASFTTRASMTALEGSAIAELSIVNASNEKVGTANFAVLIENSTFPTGVTYSTDPSVYEDILKYVQSGNSSLTTKYNNLAASVNTEISNFETTITNRVNNIVAQAGADNSEIVDARLTFSNTAKANLKTRLNEFLEYEVKGTVDGIGTIGSLSEEITAIVIQWLNTHPANLVYAQNGTVAIYVKRSTSDIDE